MPTMLSPSLRRLPYNLIYTSSFTFNVILFLLLLPVERTFIDNGDSVIGKEEYVLKSNSMVAAAEDAAEAKLKAIFIADIKKLLTHNQVFYNTYGQKDDEVDLAFDEARIAADVIHLRPDIFHHRIQNINYQINEALKKAKEEEEKNAETTADGVPVFFVDKYLLLFGMMRGIVHFPA